MPARVLTDQKVHFDAEFVRALRSGDPAAFTEVVRAFTPQVRRMAMRYFKSPFEQEEAVQEAFLLLHRQKEAIDPLRTDTLASFIFTLSRRRMIDLLRGNKLELAPHEPREEDWLDDGPDPSQRAQDQELAALLAQFERKLKPSHRSFFRAVFVEGREFDEARATLGVGALRSRYLKKVLLARLRCHVPLLEYLGRRNG